jgi:hypothetical protein
VLHVPKSIAMADEKGVADVLQSEVFGALQGGLINLGSQVYYGTTVDSSGFPGFKEILAAFNASMEVDATGAAAGTGSSVWMINAGIQGIRMCYGMGSAITMSPWTEQQIVDPNASGKYIPAYVYVYECVGRSPSWASKMYRAHQRFDRRERKNFDLVHDE